MVFVVINEKYSILEIKRRYVSVDNVDFERMSIGNTYLVKDKNNNRVVRVSRIS